MRSNLCKVLDEIKRQRGCGDEQTLARVLGVSTSTLSHYRSGSRGASLERIDMMADLLDIDPYELHAFLKGGNTGKVSGTGQIALEN